VIESLLAGIEQGKKASSDIDRAENRGRPGRDRGQDIVEPGIAAVLTGKASEIEAFLEGVELGVEAFLAEI
jgi:hypothetical protein